MARMNQTVKEVLQIVVFLVVVGLLVMIFAVYPLNRTKAILGRSDMDEINPDSLPMNDPTAFVDAGLSVDTFRIEPDGLTNLACLDVHPTGDTLPTAERPVPRGTAILLHDEREDRAAMIPLAGQLADSGFFLCVYDQRGTGYSSGEYHGDGQLEAGDLGEVIAYLAVRDLIHHPFMIVGFGVGADAAIIRAREEPRIDGVVAVKPYLTTDRWFDMLKQEYGMYWTPFGQTMFTFWYEMRSGYSIPDRGLDNLQGVFCPTLLVAPPDQLDDEAVTVLGERSEQGLLRTMTLPADTAALDDTIVRFVVSEEPPEAAPSD
jgi:pimeloyl-ACP methyl ester carboxylesterase